ncbi:hypothetical protein ACHAXA_011607 [Cyclostephanos tholiformis]|uniref:SET domain-containing protein n=1 Tax=Cyclostephanos tholiformis TaxID=382380 RepID=A0ABD3RV61_9STRA
MRLLSLVVSVVPFFLCATCANSTEDADIIDDPLISKFPILVKWFRDNGGMIDDRVAIGYEPGSDVRGTIATADIPAETIIMHIPVSLVIRGSNPDDWCQSIEAVNYELGRGEQSKWYNYFDFDDSAGSRLPLEWERDGASGGGGSGRAIRELQGLPPAGETHQHIDYYKQTCRAGRDLTDIDFRAFKMYITRAADIGMLPMYDLMNHHNGKINTRLSRDDDGGLFVISMTDIPAGAPIYNTYARSGWESTIDSFNTYGFVEDYPRLWRWTDTESGQLSEYHAHDRYVKESEDDDLPHPNSSSHEVLVISPTLAVLSPSKDLTYYLGNKQLSLDGWQKLIDNHHFHLRSSYVNTLRDSAMKMLEELPTTIEDDERLLASEKIQLERVHKMGRDHVNKADAIRAIEYRLAFKRALQLVVTVAERDQFFVDKDEL